MRYKQSPSNGREAIFECAQYMYTNSTPGKIGDYFPDKSYEKN